MRNADYSLLSIVKRFKPTSNDHAVGSCANFQSQVGRPNIDAPIALARLCALFHGLEIKVGGQEFYKTTWETILEHRETGHFVTFYDYKGGFSYGSDVYGDKTPTDFLDDVKTLLGVLGNPQCPHPYDGCAVGEEA